MVKVPRLSDDRVKQTPVPGVRVRTSADPEAFNAGPSARNVTKATGNLLGEVQKIAQQEIQRANNAKNLESASSLSEFENVFMNDALSRKGENSFTLPDEFENSFDARAQEIREGLSNDSQRLSFDKMSLQYKSSMGNRINNHVRGETFTYYNQKTDALVENEIVAAGNSAGDPSRIALSLERQDQAIDQFGEDNGLPKELIEAKKFSSKSRTHIAVIDALLVSNTTEAMDYFNANRKEINSKNMNKADLEKKITAYHKANVAAIEDSLVDKEIVGELTPQDILSVGQPVEEGGIGGKKVRVYLNRIKKAQESDLNNIIKENKKRKGYINLVDKMTDDNVDNFNLKQLIVEAHADGEITKEERNQIASVRKILDHAKYTRDKGWWFPKSVKKIKKILEDSGFDDEEVKNSLSNILDIIAEENPDEEKIEQATNEILTKAHAKANPSVGQYKDGETVTRAGRPYKVIFENGKPTFKEL